MNRPLLSKRCFTLLEVMIAFILIVMCIFPLIYPHAFILLSQKKFIQEIETDHLVNLAYADIIERLYWNEIPWNAIVNGQEFPIDEFFLQRIRYEKDHPYNGSFRFSEIIRQKPRKQEEIPTHFLLQLDLTFIPKGKSKNEEGELPEDSLTYTYNVFIARDLGQGILPEDNEDEEAKEGVEEEKKGATENELLTPTDEQQQPRKMSPEQLEELLQNVPPGLQEDIKELHGL